VHAGFGGTDGEFGVHGVRERDVDRVNVLQAAVELAVREGANLSVPRRQVRDFPGWSLTNATSREFARAWANDGRTAAWAI
jgi:hypothetical protein